MISFTESDLMTADDPEYLYTPGMLLSEGNYTVIIDYTTSTDCRIDLYGDYNATYIDSLISGSTQYIKGISLTDDAQGSKIRFTLPADGSLQIHSITVLGERFIYNDAIYFTVLYILFLSVIWLIIYKRIYIKWKGKDLFVYSCLAVLMIISSIPQLRTSLIDGTDLGGQLIRLEGIKDALLERQFPVILFPRTANEYGELGFMYPHLFLYPLALLRILNISITTVYSTTCILTNVASVLLTFYAIKSITKSDYSALLAVTVFTFLPTRMATLTYDGSLFGSGFAATFIAFTIAGIYQLLYDDRRKWWFLTLGLTGIFQAHLVTTLIMLLITVLIFLGFIYKMLNKEKILTLLKAAITFILINLWYIIPFLHYYTTEALGMEALGNTYFTYPLQELFCNPNFVISLFMLLFGIYYLVRYKAMKDKYYSFMLCLAVIDSILLLSLNSHVPWKWLRQCSPIYFFTSTLQFASRLYIVTGLIGAVLFSVFMSKVLHSINSKRLFIFVIAVIMLCVNSKGIINYMLSPQVFLTQKVGYLQPYIQREYLPPNTANEYFAGNSCTLSDENSIYAENYLKHGSRLVFSYQTDLTNAYVEVPMFYYNDYTAKSDDGTPIILSDGTHHKIRISLPPTDALRTVTVSYEASPWYKMWCLVSLLSTVVCIHLVKKQKL